MVHETSKLYLGMVYDLLANNKLSDIEKECITDMVEFVDYEKGIIYMSTREFRYELELRRYDK